MYVTHTCIHIAHIAEYELFGPLYLHITEPCSCPFRYLAPAINNAVFCCSRDLTESTVKFSYTIIPFNAV